MVDTTEGNSTSFVQLLRPMSESTPKSRFVRVRWVKLGDGFYGEHIEPCESPFADPT